MVNLKTAVMAVALAFGASAASAASIGFESGFFDDKKYYEGGFVFEVLGKGNNAISTPKGCKNIDTGVNSNCMLLPNNNNGKVVKMSVDGGGVFDLLSFTFDGRDGQGPALYVSKTLSDLGTLFSESNTSNVLVPTGPLSQFKDVTMVFFRDAGKGSSRVDDIEVSVPEVPLPASALLLLAGLGGLGVMRRRK